MNRTPSDFDTTCKQLWSIEVIIAISMMLGSFSCIARNKSHVLLNNQYSNCFPMLTISCFSKLMVVEFPRSFTETYHQASLKIHCSVQFSSVQFSSVAQSCTTLWDPMNCSTPGLPVHHQLQEFIQAHVHQVSDAIQPSHPLSSPSPPAPNP